MTLQDLSDRDVTILVSSARRALPPAEEAAFQRRLAAKGNEGMLELYRKVRAGHLKLSAHQEPTEVEVHAEAPSADMAAGFAADAQ